MAYLTEITTEHDTYTGQTIDSIIRREYGRKASYNPSADENPAHRGQIVEPSEYDSHAFRVLATVYDYTPGDYEKRGGTPDEDYPSERRMTGSELHAIRLGFSLSGANLASRLGVREDTLHRWEKDRDPIPYNLPSDLERIGEDLIGEIQATIADLVDFT